MPAERGATRASVCLALNVVLFTYLIWFRSAGLSQTFWLYGDQVRDWQVALKPLGDLPLVGPPSLAGGNTAGPVYYWLLWLIARTIGPFVEDLPHAGGIGIAALQALGDCAVFSALGARLRSMWLAVAIVLVVATAPPDAAISATIWNPPVAIALAKLGMAFALLRGVGTPRDLAIATALLWMAVQAHTTTLPILLAVLSYALFPVAPSTAAGWFGQRLATALGVIAVLQVPWLIHRATVTAAPDSTPMGISIAAVLRDPVGAARPMESAQAIARALHVNTAAPLPEAAVAFIVAAGAALLLWRSRDRLLQALALGPLAFAVIVFAVWQGGLAENYWFLALSTPAALCALAWIATLESRAVLTIGVAAVALLASVQPSRAALAQITLRTPIYGAMVDGARAAAASGYAIRELRADFEVPAGTDPAFLYTILGGRLDPGARLRARLDITGRIRFESVE